MNISSFFNSNINIIDD